MKRTQFYSIFGQLDAVVAQCMVKEGKVRRIEPDMIPRTALYNEHGNRACFAIIMSDAYLPEYERRLAQLRA